MKTITIKGKKYVPVVERLKEFREKYPDCKIKPSIIDVSSEHVVMVATILDKDGNEIAWGHAGEKREGRVNTTSWVENCETSAIGRALALLGIGVLDDIASADEMVLARDPEPSQIDQIETLLKTSNLDSDKRSQVENSIYQLTFARAEKCIEWLKENQLDPIEAGFNYNQGDIQKKLDHDISTSSSKG